MPFGIYIQNPYFRINKNIQRGTQYVVITIVINIRMTSKILFSYYLKFRFFNNIGYSHIVYITIKIPGIFK